MANGMRSSCPKCHHCLTPFSAEMLTPYNVSVMPRNPAGCGDIITITCFTQAGGGMSVTMPACLPLPMPLPSPVPASAPADVEVSRSTDNPRIITVTWQPLTLVEARGFIEYLVQLHEVSSSKRQDELTQRVPMDQSSTTFTVDDTSISYEASVGTVSLFRDTVGPGQHMQ